MFDYILPYLWNVCKRFEMCSDKWTVQSLTGMTLGWASWLQAAGHSHKVPFAMELQYDYDEIDTTGYMPRTARRQSNQTTRIASLWTSSDEDYIPIIWRMRGRIRKKVTWAQPYFGRCGEVFSFIVAKELDQNKYGSFYRGRRGKVLNFVVF